MSARSDIKAFPPKGEYGFCGKFLTVYIIEPALESRLLDIIESLVFFFSGMFAWSRLS